MTQQDFESDYGRLAYPRPFASQGNVEPIMDSAGTNDAVNYTDGFPAAYSCPKSARGKYVTRQEMNAIGNLASRNDFYYMAGGVNTFNIAFAHKVGGYPKGAILKAIVGDYIYDVISLEDNNKYNFNGVAGTGDYADILAGGIDGEHWKQLNRVYEEESDIVLDADVNITANAGVMPLGAFVPNKLGQISAFIVPGITVTEKLAAFWTHDTSTINNGVGIMLDKGIIGTTGRPINTVCWAKSPYHTFIQKSSNKLQETIAGPTGNLQENYSGVFNIVPAGTSSLADNELRMGDSVSVLAYNYYQWTPSIPTGEVYEVNHYAMSGRLQIKYL